MSVRTTDHVTIPAAVLANLEWRKATASGWQNDCVELTFVPGGEESGHGAGFVAVRDSKSLAGGGAFPSLVLPRTSLTSLVRFTDR